MDHNDRQAIEGLFHKLGQAARSQPHRDPEAEALIGDLIARNPGAAYYLAQTVIVQEQALAAAEQFFEEAAELGVLGAVGTAGSGSSAVGDVVLSRGGSEMSWDASVRLARGAICGCETGATRMGAGEGLGSNRTCTIEVSCGLADPAGGRSRNQ